VVMGRGAEENRARPSMAASIHLLLCANGDGDGVMGASNASSDVSSNCDKSREADRPLSLVYIFDDCKKPRVKATRARRHITKWVTCDMLALDNADSLNQIPQKGLLFFL
jgi:hypothetical protein